MSHIKNDVDECVSWCPACRAPSEAAPPCPRCSECVGQEHHWLENYRLADEGDPYFICKHCDAACNEKDPDEGIPEPSGILVAQPPICDDCDWYTKDCDCEPNDDVAVHNGERCPECGVTDPDDCHCGDFEPDSNATLGLTDQNVRLK